MAVNPHLHLWRAVLLVGLQDTAAGRDTAWIRSADFAVVCTLAQVEPDVVRAAFDPERFRKAKKVA